jgi:hypothetical protein
MVSLPPDLQACFVISYNIIKAVSSVGLLHDSGMEDQEGFTGATTITNDPHITPVRHQS